MVWRWKNVYKLKGIMVFGYCVLYLYVSDRYIYKISFAMGGQGRRLCLLYSLSSLPGGRFVYGLLSFNSSKVLYMRSKVSLLYRIPLRSKVPDYIAVLIYFCDNYL